MSINLKATCFAWIAFFAALTAANSAMETNQSYGVGLEPNSTLGGFISIDGTLSGNGEVSLFDFSTGFFERGNAVYTEHGGLIQHEEYPFSNWSAASLSANGDRFIRMNKHPLSTNRGLEIYEIGEFGNVSLVDVIAVEEMPGDLWASRQFAVSGKEADPLALLWGAFTIGNGDFFVHDGDDFVLDDSLVAEADDFYTTYRLHEGGGPQNTVYFSKQSSYNLSNPQSVKTIFAYDGESLVKTSIDLSGLSGSVQLSDHPLSPNGRFVLFKVTDLNSINAFSLAVYDQKTDSFDSFTPEALHGETLGLSLGSNYYSDYRITSSGMIFATTVIRLEGPFLNRIPVVIAPDGTVQTIEDYLLERLPESGEGITSNTLDAIEIYELLDFSDDGLRLLVTGQDVDGSDDAFLIDLLTGSFLSARQLGLIEDRELSAFIESGSASPELISQFRTASHAQIAEFGRGLSSILPGAVSNILSNALNHTFNLNSRFDALHRESLFKLNGARSAKGLGVYAYSTAVSRNYDSNVSSVSGNMDSLGAMLVVDQKITDSLFVGLGFGLKSDDSDFNTGADLESDTLSASLYASSRLFENFYVDALFQYADVDMDSTRSSFDTLRAEPEAEAYGVELRASYYFHRGAFTLSPKLSLGYNHLDFKGYTESGGISAASVESFDVDSFQLSSGLQIQYQWQVAHRPLIGIMQVEWKHEFIDDSEIVSSTAAGASFKTLTDRPDQDTGLVTLGLNYYLSEAMTIYGEYSENFGDQVNEDQVVRLGFSYSF